MIDRRLPRLKKYNKYLHCIINSDEDFESILGYFII